MKKLIALVLVLMMAVMPLMSQAAGARKATDLLTDMLNAYRSGKAIVGEMTFEIDENMPQLQEAVRNGGDASIVSAVVDLFNAIGLTGYVQKGQAGAAFQLSGNDVAALSVLSAEDEGAVYVASNLFGGPAIRLSVADLAAIQKFNAFASYDQMVASGYITAEQAQTLKDEYKAPSLPDLSQVDWTAFSFDNTMRAVMTLMGKMETGETEDGGTWMRITLDGDDAVALTAALVADVKSNTSLMDAVNAYIVSVEGTGTLEEALDEITAQVEKEKDTIRVVVETTVSADGSHMTMTETMGRDGCDGVVAMDMTMTGEAMNMTVSYTAANGARAALTVDVQPQGEEAAKVGVDLVITDKDGKDIVVMDLDADVRGEENYTCTMNVDVNADTEAVNVKMDMNATPAEEHMTMTGTMNGELFMTEKVDTVKDHSSDDMWVNTSDMLMVQSLDGRQITTRENLVDTIVFGAEPSIQRVVKIYAENSDEVTATVTGTLRAAEARPAVTTEDATRIAEMDQMDYETWTAGLAQNATMALTMALIQNLPASVLTMMMQQSR